MVTAPPELCAVCASPVTITDWRPFEDWLAVEGCLCNGFFMRKCCGPDRSGGCRGRTARPSVCAFGPGGRTDARPGCPPRPPRMGASSSPDSGGSSSEIPPRPTNPGPGTGLRLRCVRTHSYAAVLTATRGPGGQTARPLGERPRRPPHRRPDASMMLRRQW
jgi:hypothetical protein